MAGSDKKKIRAQFRKNRSQRARRTDWTRQFGQEQIDEDKIVRGERVSGKGELSRKRTVRGTLVENKDSPDLGVQLHVDEAGCVRGRVISIHGLTSTVLGPNGESYHCATRRLLKTLSTDQRNVVAVGDHVLLRPLDNEQNREGFIERIEPRHGCICREIRGRQQVFVANIDQVAIVASADEPPLKPNLIDRMLVAAEKGGVRPLICINKIDLADVASLQPLIGVYSQMGYEVLLLSAKTNAGVRRLAKALHGRQTVMAGQSGVGKSSLLNTIDPDLNLKVQTISEESRKGRHTTSVARLLPLACGGYVVDTPGIRQFELWDVIPSEVPGFFRDIRPFVSLCRFPDCTHTHEADCAVKNAVADGRIDERRYESYCHMIDEEEDAK
jgi:ribosome biogenesis GTPase / thiamine phosphate phosphatase